MLIGGLMWVDDLGSHTNDSQKRANLLVLNKTSGQKSSMTGLPTCHFPCGDPRLQGSAVTFSGAVDICIKKTNVKRRQSGFRIPKIVKIGSFLTKLSKKIMGWFFLRHSVESIKLNQSIKKLFRVAKVTKINCKQGELSYKLTPCFFKLHSMIYWITQLKMNRF